MTRFFSYSPCFKRPDKVLVVSHDSQKQCDGASSDASIRYACTTIVAARYRPR